jgi:prepilin-type N-terminal cleavage/methylation domain-containing protein
MNFKIQKKGFTLVELIIVIAIIAILAGAIFVAIDPARRLHEARNARRLSDIVTILQAAKRYQADHGGAHYASIANAEADVFHPIAAAALSCDSTCTAETISNDCVDLSDIGSDYLVTLPRDPQTGTDAFTGYFIRRDSLGSLTVGACEPEGEGPGGNGTPPSIRLSQ